MLSILHSLYFFIVYLIIPILITLYKFITRIPTPIITKYSIVTKNEESYKFYFPSNPSYYFYYSTIFFITISILIKSYKFSIITEWSITPKMKKKQCLKPGGLELQEQPFLNRFVSLPRVSPMRSARSRKRSATGWTRSNHGICYRYLVTYIFLWSFTHPRATLVRRQLLYPFAVSVTRKRTSRYRLTWRSWMMILDLHSSRSYNRLTNIQAIFQDQC